jgi:hypothetical protein
MSQLIQHELLGHSYPQHYFIRSKTSREFIISSLINIWNLTLIELVVYSDLKLTHLKLGNKNFSVCFEWGNHFMAYLQI